MPKHSKECKTIVFKNIVYKIVIYTYESIINHGILYSNIKNKPNNKAEKWVANEFINLL